jgi:hypothetical protein
VFSNTIPLLAQNKKQLRHFKWFLLLKLFLMPSAPLFPRQSYNCDESDGLPDPNKLKLTATLLQNIGFSQNM